MSPPLLQCAGEPGRELHLGQRPALALPLLGHSWRFLQVFDLGASGPLTHHITSLTSYISFSLSFSHYFPIFFSPSIFLSFFLSSYFSVSICLYLNLSLHLSLSLSLSVTLSVSLALSLSLSVTNIYLFVAVVVS